MNAFKLDGYILVPNETIHGEKFQEAQAFHGVILGLEALDALRALAEARPSVHVRSLELVGEIVASA